MNLHQKHAHLALASCVQLTAASIALWLLLAIPAWLTAGGLALEGLSYAAVLCLVPGLAVLLVGSRFQPADSQMLVVVLGGMTLRMVFALVGSLVIHSWRADLQLREFFIWLIVFYLATLLVETLLVVRRQANVEARSGDETGR